MDIDVLLPQTKNMKLLVKLVLIIVITIIAIGYYYKSLANPKGDAIIGVGIITLSFVLMPLFIYSRYRSKKISAYKFKKEEDL